MSASSSEFDLILRPILTGNQGNGAPSTEESQSREEECATPKGEESRISTRCPDPPRKRRCVVISKRIVPESVLISVEKEEMDRLFVKRDRVGCGVSVRPGSKRKWCSVSDES